MSKTYSAGIVTAYGAAKRAGYQGTYEDFCRQQAGYAESAATVEQAKNTAVSAAQSAVSASTTAQTASTTAVSASNTASAQAQSAGQSAVDAQTYAQSAQGSAQSASASAGSAQASAQTAQAVLESIPEDYSDLSSDVVQLKADLDASVGNYVNITSADLEDGGFSTDTGKYADSRRIRAKKAYYCPHGGKITLPDNGLYYFLWFLRDGNVTNPNVISSSVIWVNSPSFDIPDDCYVYIAIANAYNWGASTDISVNDFPSTSKINISIFAARGKEVTALDTKLTNFEQQIKPLYMGDFVIAGFSATAFTQSTQRLCMKDCVALPYGEKTKIKVTMNRSTQLVTMYPPTQVEYLFAVRAGRTPQNLSSNKYWYKSGDIVTFDANEQYYRVIFAQGFLRNDGINYSYYDITLDELAKINPVIEYYKDTVQIDTFTANSDNLERLINAKNVLSASSHGGTTTYPIIFHASDFHGDYERFKNVLMYSEHCDADAVVLSGDIVSNRPLDGAGWMHKLFADFKGKPIICTGNHDVDDSNYTDADVYEYYMAPSASKIGNTNGKTYYYTDIPSKSLRIIVTDIYQYGATTRSNAHMSSEQLAYICTALKTAPNGYGILIVAHTPCVNVWNLADANYSTFFQSLRKYGFTHYDITGTPIYDIVDAFNARTTISKTYTQTGSPSSISVDDDFSGVDASIEFIAHLTGHIHEDSVCYLPTQTKQLMLNICCGVAMTGGSGYPYLADDCDITRLPYDKTQDAINVYVIDRTNRTIKIVRIGGTLTYDMKERKYMIIPYAD